MIPVLLLAMAVGALAGTQKNRAGQGSGAASQELIELENKWVKALVKSDTETLSSIFIDTYVDTDEHSHRSNKDGVLSFLKSGDLKLDSIKLSDMQVHLYGDAAGVTVPVTPSGSFVGGPLAARIIFTDPVIQPTWKWRGGPSATSVPEWPAR